MVFRSASVLQKMTVDTLMGLSPYTDGQDQACVQARTLLVDRLTRQDSVRETFFASRPSQTTHDLSLTLDNGFDLDRLAVLYVLQAMYKRRDKYKMFTMIDDRKVEKKLREIYKSLLWKKVGFQLYSAVFPDVVRDKRSRVSLRDFMCDDRHRWAQKLKSEVCRPSWVKVTLRRIVQCQYTEDDYNQDMNVLLVKLHLLDPQTVMPTYQFLQREKALPELRLELATRNYLGDGLDYRVIQADVDRAINKESLPLRTSRLSLNEVNAYRGVDVIEFMGRQATEYWTGKLPDNRRTSRFHDRCTVM